MRPISVTLGPYAAGVANNIATAQTLTGTPPLAFAINGALVSGGWAVLDNPRQVAITSAGNDTGVLFMITGASGNGDPLGETVRGTNGGVVLTNNLFKRVFLVTASGPTSSVTIGTASAPFYSRPLRLDEWADAQAVVQVAVTGTVSFTVAGSFDEGPDALVNPIPVSAMAWDSGTAIGIPAGAVAGTASISFPLATAPLWLRIALNSGSGSVRMNVVQYNVVTA